MRIFCVGNQRLATARSSARAASPHRPTTRACPTAPLNRPCGLTSPPCHPCVPVRATLPPVRARPGLTPPCACPSVPPLHPYGLTSPPRRPCVPITAPPCLNRGLNGLRGLRGLPHTSPPPLYRSHPLCPSHPPPPSVVGTGPCACPYLYRYRSHRHVILPLDKQ